MVKLVIVNDQYSKPLRMMSPDELDDLVRELKDYYSDDSITSLPKLKKCECGAKKLKLPFHADWCDLYQEQK